MRTTQKGRNAYDTVVGEEAGKAFREGRLAEGQTGRQRGREAGKQAERLAGRQAERQAGREAWRRLKARQNPSQQFNCERTSFAACS